ncbi:hypothetical protein BBW65_04250 [Helicobacter enhydrae]|uniref:Alpha-1,2-fucosyltransferase n=1 Tax=Helicobacter enhydrae TaxID=222136 RepID=A0A1B1U5Q6_9HELI|nr:alpha-1,2-fucosyltransferase [Helicobacter enhydrae]ANV98061.1 hypothetical protein BBW65_04250 [Helicobacter enhydrae]
MFSVRLMGGLGNQMFIYAFAKAIKAQGYPVRLFYYDTDYNVPQTHNIRNLEIVDFGLNLPIQRLCSKGIHRNVKRIIAFIHRKIAKYLFTFVSDCHNVSPTKDFLDTLNPNAMFNGYFQNVVFFDHLRESLLRDFTLKRPLTPANEALKHQILQTPNSCFLHIRRGDFLPLPEYIQLDSTAYYNNAIKALKDKISKPHIFVFSNDIAWCKEFFLDSLDPLVIENVTFSFVENNDEGNAIEEMELMRSCQHAIIANSTFSWWAAYLIDSAQKLCIMPQRFYGIQQEENCDIPPPPHTLAVYSKN